MNRRRVVVALTTAVVLLSTACSKPASRRKVTLIYATRAAQAWPLFIAKEGGYYEKYGFDVDLQFVLHPGAVAAVVSGQALMSPYALEQSMEASFRGGESLVMLGAPYKKSSFALLAAKSIHGVAGLKGKRIAVTQLGDAPYNYTVGLLAKAGLSARDVEWVPVGVSANGRAAALVGGRADATMLTAPEWYKVEAEGYTVLANIKDDGDIYAPSVYLFHRPDVEGNDVAERMIQAQAEATKRFYDDEKFAVDAMLKWNPGQTREDVERAWKEYGAMGAYERVPYVLRAAVQYVLDHPSDKDSAAAMRAYDFHKVIDNSPVDKLVKEGFFVKLFGEEIRAEQERKSAAAFR